MNKVKLTKRQQKVVARLLMLMHNNVKEKIKLRSKLKKMNEKFNKLNDELSTYLDKIEGVKNDND